MCERRVRDNSVVFWSVLWEGCSCQELREMNRGREEGRETGKKKKKESREGNCSRC